MNSQPNRLALRAAGRIQEHYAQRHTTPSLPELPGDLLITLDRLRRQQRLADRKQFQAASQIVRARYLEDLNRLAGRCRDQVAAGQRQEAPLVPTLRTLYEELLGLHEEFDAVEIDLRAGELAVQTERIILDDVDLGPFEIRLDWCSLGSVQPYEVIALEPHPAGSSDDTMHPHVQSGSLCEGEGKGAIKAALRDGRLGDFFLIVSSILNTYNSSSAYVSLDEWDGATCQECDARVPEEDISACEQCGWRLCLECVRSCGRCGAAFCAECERICRSCDLAFCRSCLTTCSRCRTATCLTCRREELCPACVHPQPDSSHETPSHSNDQIETAPAATAPPAPPEAVQEAGAPVHPDRLGQAAVPA